MSLLAALLTLLLFCYPAVFAFLVVFIVLLLLFILNPPLFWVCLILLIIGIIFAIYKS